MCDGHYDKRDKIIKICTDSFLPTEVLLLQSVFQENFGIISKMHSNGYKDKNQYRIYIPRLEAIKVKYIIKEYLINSMLYKIGE